MNLNFGLSKTTSLLPHLDYTLICLTIDLSFIDSRISLPIFKFLRLVYGEIRISISEWDFSASTCLTFPFFDLNSLSPLHLIFVTANFLRDAPFDACIPPTIPLRARCDTWSIFKRNKAYLNSFFLLLN